MYLLFLGGGGRGEGGGASCNWKSGSDRNVLLCPIPAIEGRVYPCLSLSATGDRRFPCLVLPATGRDFDVSYFRGEEISMFMYCTIGNQTFYDLHYLKSEGGEFLVLHHALANRRMEFSCLSLHAPRRREFLCLSLPATLRKEGISCFACHSLLYRKVKISVPLASCNVRRKFPLLPFTSCNRIPAFYCTIPCL